jgi:ribonucleoside-diphosphate reductase subunit M2
MEEILSPENNRYTFYPVKYYDIYSMYRKQVDCFWRCEEVDISKDMKDWDKLTENERNFILTILAFFSSSDGIVMENLACRFMNDVTVAEARAFYGFQIMMENIHSEMYSILIDSYVKDKNIKERLFNAIEIFPCIQRKATWAKHWISNQASAFAERLVAFAVVEGIFFSSAFASIFWLKKRGLLPALCFSNELISRDEALHTEFAVLLYSKLKTRLTKDKVYEIIKEAVEIEKDFILEAIPCRLIGMNSILMSQYIEFVADRLALQLGYPKIYDTKNPFDFMEMISLEGKTNFFEKRVSEYALANKTIDEQIFNFTDNEF